MDNERDLASSIEEDMIVKLPDGRVINANLKELKNTTNRNLTSGLEENYNNGMK